MTTRPSPTAAIARRLREAPHTFEFHQAARLLLRGGGALDLDPREEPVRFRSRATLRFRPSGAESVKDRAGSKATELVANFLGIVGPDGALPDHYTELVIHRVRMRDTTLREFLDLFHHRMLAMAHRGWAKYRLAASAETALSRTAQDDPIAEALFAVAGFATGGLRKRLEVHDDVFLWFAGHFGRRARPAVCLEAILTDYFEIPVAVEQFQGEWLTLPLAERTALPSPRAPAGSHNRLGRDAILGKHSFDVQGRFGLRAGPVGYATYRRLMPTGDLLRPFTQLARTYAGPALAFDVRPVLAAGEAPCHRLGVDDGDPPRLGWNTWLLSGPLGREFASVAFSLDRA